ncbi:MAG: hypothetical protein K8R02_01235 [Anaerohalosphaeraceae bacterium]|nr:hypothetical protein [Anaerohalosphaeraceae bacterium]
MESKQKRLLKKIMVVSVFTIIMVLGLTTLRNYINRSEAVRAMDLLGREALTYRKNYGSLPSESHIKKFLDRIQAVRVGNMSYRAIWIEYGSDPDRTVLAYAKKSYEWPLQPGYVVLWLNGKTQWLAAEEFEPILRSQQQKIEMDLLQKDLKKQQLP